MKTYTDAQLKRVLAAMLPEKVVYAHGLCWLVDVYGIEWSGKPVLDTELAQICLDVEKTLCEYSGEHGQDYSQQDRYAAELMKLNGVWAGNAWRFGDMCNADLFRAANASWQQRTIALAKVKGIEIV